MKNKGYILVKKTIQQKRKKKAADDVFLATEVWNALVKAGMIKKKFNIYHGYDMEHHFVD
ncbi:MAG: hypothetical protein WC139_07140 [Candidatus Kapaibacterium sp.]